MKFIKILTATILFILSVDAATAGERPSMSYGVYGSFNSVMHSAGFPSLPGMNTCCRQYNDATGSGFSGGILLRGEVSEKTSWQLRAGYTVLGGQWEEQEVIGNVYDANWNTTEAVSSYNLDATLGLAELSPMIAYEPFTFPLELRLGVNIGYFVQSDFSNSEELISPTDARFSNGSRFYDNEGSIEELTTPFMAAIAMLGYDIELSRTMILSPEIGYSFNFLDITSEEEWKAHSLRVGVSLRYWGEEPLSEPAPTPPPPSVPLPPPPPDTPKPVLSVIALAMDEQGNQNNISQMRIREYLSRQVHPLLPYIFFDHNSSEIPARYDKLSLVERFAFNEKNFYNVSTLDVYHNILNIIGSRMNENKKASITLTGCNAGAAENNDKELSRARAESCKEYLVNIWDIEANRIKVEYKNLPSLPSNIQETDGLQENQRVEIGGLDYDLMEHLTVRDTIRETSPPIIAFVTTVKAYSELDKWKIEARQEGGMSKEFTGEGTPPSVVKWDVGNDKNYDFIPQADMVYKLIVESGSEKWESGDMKLPIDAFKIERTETTEIMAGNDKEYDKFSLISFGYNSSELDSRHKEIVRLARSKLKPDSKVSIIGYTDRTGDDAHNLQLSLKRALSTAKALGVALETAVGKGEENPMFSNELPEGRFYNRTVYINIENKK